MKQLTKNDHNSIMEYILREPEFNTYIIGDIKQFGYNNKVLKLYTTDNSNGYDFLLMNYLSDYVLYSHHLQYDAKQVADFLISKGGCISGKSEIIDKLVKHLIDKVVRNTYLAAVRLNNLQIISNSEYTISSLDENHSGQILTLYLQIEEFKSKYSADYNKALESISFSFRSGRSYGIWKDKLLISVASSTAENEISAMITNVATHPKYRGLGLASSIVSTLSKDLLNDGRKFIALYYDNQAASHVYKKIGFVEIGSYSTLR